MGANGDFSLAEGPLGWLLPEAQAHYIHQVLLERQSGKKPNKVEDPEIPGLVLLYYSHFSLQIISYLSAT